MASFSDKLKEAQSISTASYTLRKVVESPAVMDFDEPSVMTLSNDSEMIAAYSGEETWTKPDNASFYDYYTEYYDDKFSTLDDEKGIVLSAGQINLTQEKNSQYIPFRINRHYDGFDLATTKLSFYWVNKLGYGGDIPAVDVYCTEDKLKFALLVDSDMTAVAGDLNIEIHAEGTNSLGRGYLWKTKPSKGLNVIQALEIKTFIEPDESWQTSFVEKLSAQADRAEKAALNAEASATAAQNLVDELQDGLADEVSAVIADNYYNKTQTEEYVAHEIGKIDIPTVPTNVGDFANNVGYVTATELEGYKYATEDYVKGKIGDTEEKTVVKYLEDNYVANTTLERKLGTLVDSESNELSVEEYVEQEIANQNIDGKLNDRIGNTGVKEEDGVTPISVVDYVDAAVASVDVSDQLGDLGTNEDGTTKTVVEYVAESIEAVDVSDQLGNTGTNEDGSKKTVVQYVNEAVASVDVSAQLQNYYTRDVADETFAEKSVESTVISHTSDIKDINSSITAINEELLSIDKSPVVNYRATYGETVLPDGSTADHIFTLYKKENGVEEVQDQFPISGGGDGSGSNFKQFGIKNIEGYESPLTYIVTDKAIIKYEFLAEDTVGNTKIEAVATWKIGNRTVLTEDITTGECEVDLTKYVTTGSNKFTLMITHATGRSTSMNWTIQIVDITIRSDFNNTVTYPTGSDVEFRFQPTGTVEKTVHFILDGEEIGTKTSSAAASGTDHYIIPAQEHGSHLLEAYITAEVNGKTVGLEDIVDEEGNVIGQNHTIKVLKDIVWFDSSSTTPVISCDEPVIEMTQYNSVNIKYCVFDPTTESPEVTWYLNDEVLSVEKLTPDDKNGGYYTYSYKATEAGEFELKAVCRDSEPKIITVNVSELDIDVSPVTSGLAFDFDISSPDYSNSSVNRLWSDKNTNVKMTVSDNFDWVNGGYQLDENGDKYFCVKAGTRAVIDYNLFEEAAQTNGKEFKVIFRTKNIRKRDTSFLTCMDEGIGLDMKVEQASVHCSSGTLKSLYCEDEIIEYEFNISKSLDMMVAITYEDGAPNIPFEYTNTTSFRQVTAQPITIGSDDCDVYIYRMKAYKNSLTEEEVKNNFIADARNAEDMIDRYTRNQIYNSDGKIVSTTLNGGFNADAVMKSNPQLRYIFLEVPFFTNHKDNKIDNCNVYYRYPAGTRPEDNWDCTGVRHRGQGTSSNEYGLSGRNVDLVMDRDESLFTWTDENGETVESSTITLTPTSYPTDYLNIKVNVASSENTNNAQMARRYNEFQPFLRYIRKKDSRVKDTMEFYNCVLFIRETNEDLSTHREFNDCDWHYYALGNVGDSKKTDDTRVNNPNDPREFVVELMDVDKPLSAFPTGKENNETCPVEEWCEGNSVYDILYSTDYVYEDGEFASFAGTSYEFRYEMDDITEEQREVNINVWRDFYSFLATSTDEEIYANLKKYFVVDSALYYYLFTERYTMVDSRAKNSFWHYGKAYISEEEALALGAEESSYYIIDDQMAAINDGYRFDLTFGYDFDKI